MEKLLKIQPEDNVAVAVEPISKGSSFSLVTAVDNIPFGHKIALCDINKGDNIVKYGYPIGHATENIAKGGHVHTHNIKTNLSDTLEYSYDKIQCNEERSSEALFFDGYERADGSVGIRNEIWILPTVGCVNKTAELLAKKANELFADKCDGVFAFTHPYGCSQLGEDHKNTQKVLSALSSNPNACGVLLLSLGCENNNLNSFLPCLGDYDGKRIRTLVTQEENDEIEAGLNILSELAENASLQKRSKQPLSKLTIGYKCGGSDAFSGITANPLCGKLTDICANHGARVILTEVPEMFGAETILMSRAKDKKIFEDIVKMINDFKSYFIKHNQVIYENPSPGNKDGGISTLEEKSLGCIQKGGTAQVNSVLDYGEKCTEEGLNLLTGPGNDIVSCTNLAASGANIILFTTGRGTPLGAPVPTLKISTNSALALKKQNWIDYNAGEILNTMDFTCATDELLKLVLDVASGKIQTKNEINSYREIAIFKDGVTL